MSYFNYADALLSGGFSRPSLGKDLYIASNSLQVDFLSHKNIILLHLVNMLEIL